MTVETNAPTRSNGTPQSPGCGLKFKPARDAAVTPESAGSVSLLKRSVKDSARLLGANCPKSRLKSLPPVSVGARPRYLIRLAFLRVVSAALRHF